MCGQVWSTLQMDAGYLTGQPAPAQGKLGKPTQSFCVRMQLAEDSQGKPTTVRVETPQPFLVALPGLRALSERLSDLSAGASKLNHKLRLCNGSSDF